MRIQSTIQFPFRKFEGIERQYGEFRFSFDIQVEKFKESKIKIREL